MLIYWLPAANIILTQQIGHEILKLYVIIENQIIHRIICHYRKPNNTQNYMSLLNTKLYSIINRIETKASNAMSGKIYAPFIVKQRPGIKFKFVFLWN